MNANVPAGDLRTVVNDLGIVPHYTEGTFGADVAVRGAGLAPQVSGPIAVPAGSVNGLYFTDAKRHHRRGHERRRRCKMER